jgi:hypothetical protein
MQASAVDVRRLLPNAESERLTRSCEIEGGSTNTAKILSSHPRTSPLSGAFPVAARSAAVSPSWSKINIFIIVTSTLIAALALPSRRFVLSIVVETIFMPISEARRHVLIVLSCYRYGVFDSASADRDLLNIKSHSTVYIRARSRTIRCGPLKILGRWYALCGTHLVIKVR